MRPFHVLFISLDKINRNAERLGKIKIKSPHGSGICIISFSVKKNSSVLTNLNIKRLCWIESIIR